MPNGAVGARHEHERPGDRGDEPRVGGEAHHAELGEHGERRRV